jgi:hypothetical protein
LRPSTILLLFLGGCCCGFAAGEDATAVITGPETASPGDLIILDASGSDCDSRKWLLVGSDKSFLQFEEGRKCVFASGVSGRYHFVLATAKQGDSAVSLATSIHTITIGTPAPTPPGPDPQPTPVPPPGPELSAIAKQVRDCVATLDRRYGESHAIAAEFDAIAQRATLTVMTPTQIAAACKAIGVFQNPEAQPRWKAFSVLFSQIMSANSGDIPTTLQQIAVGIRAAEKPSATTSDPANETIRSMLDKLRGDLRGIASEVGQ